MEELSAAACPDSVRMVACEQFRVPFFDFVKYALGYSTKAYFLMSLLHVVCDVRDGLRTAFQDRPMTKDIYIEVEKVSELGDPPRRLRTIPADCTFRLRTST